MITGITGGIGSGKSTVSRLLRTMGYPVYDSDHRARIIQSEDAQLVADMIALLGDDILENNQINRREIAAKVFSDPKLLEQLNQLVHPRVREDFEHWVKRQSAEIIFKESALLIETGGFRNCDALVVVMAPESLRIDRVVQRDQVTRKEVKSRMTRQADDDQRRTYADFQIDNDEVQLLIPQVEQMLNYLRNREEGS